MYKKAIKEVDKILASLEMVIQPASEHSITNQKASIFQGILMGNIEEEYADQLHENQLHPYSQHILKQKDRNIWRITTLNQQAYENIIIPLMKPDFSSFYIERDDVHYQILDKKVVTSSRKNLIDTYYFGECDRYINVRFMTPTAFKSEGSYFFWPQLEKIYRSLMKRYDAFAENETMYDEEVFQQLVQYSEIIKYDIRSTLFHLEGVKIPSFVGSIVVKVKGPQPLVNLANVLWHYAEYAGVGIKTAIGMGVTQIVERREKIDKKRN